jgi:ankyrin repeat protein
MVNPSVIIATEFGSERRGILKLHSTDIAGNQHQCPDKYGESVLMIALKQIDEHKEFIQLLLDNGADVNLKN